MNIAVDMSISTVRTIYVINETGKIGIVLEIEPQRLIVHGKF